MRPTPALLEETIGANFERTVAAYGDREALVECATGRRWTYAELDRRRRRARPRADRAPASRKGDRVGIWAPNCAEWTLVQYATAKIGAILVNINPAYRTHELAYALNQSGLRLLVARRVVQDQRLPGDGRGGPRPTAPRCERVVYIGTDDWDRRWSPAASRSTERRARRADGDAASPTTRSTSSTRRAPPASPRARR